MKETSEKLAMSSPHLICSITDNALIIIKRLTFPPDCDVLLENNGIVSFGLESVGDSQASGPGANNADGIS